MIKLTLIYSDKEFPVGFESPVFGGDLLKLIFLDLPMSISKLLSELDDFDNYFIENKDIKPINPTMGELDKKEWTISHNKHFKHHFKQFNLLLANSYNIN